MDKYIGCVNNTRQNKDDSALAVHFKTKGISIDVRVEHCNYEGTL